MQVNSTSWEQICELIKLPVDGGVAALVGEGTEQEAQIALFRASDQASGDDGLYAISNFDPFSEANVLGRGILCSIDGELAVASPIGKEHFSLSTGRCFEDENVTVSTYPIKVSDGVVFVQTQTKGGK